MEHFLVISSSLVQTAWSIGRYFLRLGFGKPHVRLGTYTMFGYNEYVLARSQSYVSVFTCKNYACMYALLQCLGVTSLKV